ncbi:MAG TPA: 16S rRNA (adenine(1518)-N(6)/adenine(1519)-N(6))-dimethyltransferase RsmA [Candidatus Acidoferrales bacterium]|nr:16S rRNA (adenine(1518)-N(6)/adenine(1519)-N(6))-dimethyltransferase RsmA [Candidatus Acidoferrales bacterium]
MPRQKLGQHFLSQTSWRTRIAETLPADRDAIWLEIGAGHGEMTELLATRARRVIAIETDAVLAATLRERAAHSPATAGVPNVEVVHADVLSLDLAALTGERFRVYGNLPYYITSPILTHLFGFADQIDSIHIVTQLEVAQRIAAHPRSRDYGYLSTLCQFYARPELVFRIPPGAFQPPPKVTSALIEMYLPGERDSLGIRDESAFLKFLQVCFAHKRKTLRNNLRGTYAHDAVAKALAVAALTDTSRAEELTLHQFAQIFTSLAA